MSNKIEIDRVDMIQTEDDDEIAEGTERSVRNR